MKKILIFIILIFVLSIIKLQAQENFQPGYIITNSNDTILGFITKLENESFNKCEFKKAYNQKVTTYLAGQIRAYRFENDGKFFITKKIPVISGDSVRFLEYLIKGKANIYFMRDNTDHYYIETENNPILELSEPLTLFEKMDGGAYIKPSSYRGKLKFMLADCPELYPEIEGTKLFAPELIKLAKDYHLKICNTEQCVVFEKKISKVKVHYGFTAGFTFNTFIFQDVGFTDFTFNNDI